MGIAEIRKIKEDAATKPLKKALINRVSQKRAGEEIIYLKKRKVFLEKHKTCEVKELCKGARSVDVHHTAGRAGKNYLDESTWKAACRKCHIHVTINSKQAIENGHSKSRLFTNKKIQ